MKLFKIYKSSLTNNIGRIIYTPKNTYTFKFHSKYTCVELVDEVQFGFSEYEPIQL